MVPRWLLTRGKDSEETDWTSWSTVCGGSSFVTQSGDKVGTECSSKMRTEVKMNIAEISHCSLVTRTNIVEISGRST